MTRHRNAKWALGATLSLALAAASGTAMAKTVVDLKFDEGSGSVAKDSSGSGHDGTLNNAPDWVAGKVGSALHFTAKNGGFANVEIPLTPQDVGKQGSISFWFKPDWNEGTGTVHTLLEATKTATNRAFFIADGDDGSWLEFTFEDSSDADYEDEATDHAGEIKAGNWYYITAVWDWTDNADMSAHLYVNGELWATKEAPGSGIDGFERFTIGSQRYDYWATGSADGTIDEFTIQDTALTPDQVRAAYQAAAGV